MLNLKSMIDGFKVINGSFCCHLVAFITILSCIRVPEYEEEGRTEKASMIFRYLLALHLILAITKWMELFLFPKAALLNTILMLFSVEMFVHLCSNWFYREVIPAWDTYTSE